MSTEIYSPCGCQNKPYLQVPLLIQIAIHRSKEVCVFLPLFLDLCVLGPVFELIAWIMNPKIIISWKFLMWFLMQQYQGTLIVLL